MEPQRIGDVDVVQTVTWNSGDMQFNLCDGKIHGVVCMSECLRESETLCVFTPYPGLTCRTVYKESLLRTH